MRNRSGTVDESYGYTDSLNKLIEALCRDFERRERSMEGDFCSKRTAAEYQYYNYRMLEGAMEIVGPALLEIGSRVGYTRSKVDCMSESMYKIKKLECKINMAKKLHLID